MNAKPLMALALSVALVAALSGCGRTVSEKERAVHDAIRSYNEALVLGFAEMDMNRLQGTATEAQAGNDAVLMQSLGSGGVRMVATVRSIEFGEIAFPAEDTARVTTTETWDYRHESLTTSETVRTEKGVVYRLAYDLVYQDGRWLVAAVTSLDEEANTGEETTTP